MSKGIPVYLYRDNDSFSDIKVCTGMRKPQLIGTAHFGSGKHLIDLCPDVLCRVTGFALKPGECKRARIEIKEV